MSRSFLYELNGHCTGAFRGFLDGFVGEPRIAWYPSAGEDFRDLLYLQPRYQNMNPSEKPEPAPPDVFLHTDYFPWSTSRFLDSLTLHNDSRTNLSITSIEELPRLDLPLDRGLVDFPKGSTATGRVVFLQVQVTSTELGSFICPVIYAFVENTAFLARRVLPSGARLSYVVKIRYGGGCGGGGKSSGAWLQNILKKVGAEVFISDGESRFQSGDVRALELYPQLTGEDCSRYLEQVRVIPGDRWSHHGDVQWNIVK